MSKKEENSHLVNIWDVGHIPQKKIELVGNIYYFQCPHCHLVVQVCQKDVHCGIFRHGVYIKTGRIIPAHVSKQQCEKLLASGTIYGCGKPFKFDTKTVEICDYK